MVWYGNDDDLPMEKMTGGTLPATTWHDIMQFAHSGIDLKPLPGTTLTAEQAPVVELTNAEGAQALKVREQLSKKSSEALGSIENLMKTTAEKHGAIDLTRPSRYAAAEPAIFARRREAIVDLR